MKQNLLLFPVLLIAVSAIMLSTVRAAHNSENLISYWNLDETSGTTFVDSIGSNDATCSGNSCPISDTGKLNGAQLFDGVEDGLDVADDNSLDWIVDDSFSIEVWIKSTQDCTGNKVILGKYSIAGTWWLGCNDSTDKAVFFLRDSATLTPTLEQIVGGDAINDGQWHHLIAVWDAAVGVDPGEGEMRLYVDGAEVASLIQTFEGDFANNGVLTIGYYNVSPFYSFAGVIDEVKLYDIAVAPPSITSTAVTEAIVGELYTYDVEATGNPTLTYNLAITPTGMTIDSDTGLISWTPGMGQIGSHPVAVTANNSVGTATQTFTVAVTVDQPAISVVKSPETQTTVNGSTANFTISITNTGNVPLSLNLDDPLGDANCETPPTSSLLPGGATTYPCTSSGVTADFTNIITAAGTYTPSMGAPVVVTDSDSADVTVVNPALAISKSPNSQTVANGGTADFTITITNTGDVPLSNVLVNDPLAPDCNYSHSGDLAPSGSVNLTCSLAGVTADFTNIITAAGTYTPSMGAPVVVTDSDSADVTVINPVLAISKSPNSQTVASGGTADFTITITNTGDVPLSNVLVNDPLAPDCNYSHSGDLAPSGSVNLTCSLVGVTADFTNTASVMAQDPLANSLQNADTAFVDVPPSINATLFAETTTLTEPGGLITFTVTLTNHSSEDTTLASLTSDVFGDLTDNTNNQLVTTTCMAGAIIPSDESTYACSFSAEFLEEPGSHIISLTATAKDDEDNEASDVSSIMITIAESPDTFTYLPIVIKNE